MPYFKRRVLETVEAYRLPQEGKEESDGLRFWLEANSIGSRNLYAEELGEPGDWLVLSPDDVWFAMTNEEFHTTYKSLEG
tara:strand:- start:465 stop:704 length:240 start_codon:yes stop_codon:yes gene_type:complete